MAGEERKMVNRAIRQCLEAKHQMLSEMDREMRPAMAPKVRGLDSQDAKRMKRRLQLG